MRAGGGAVAGWTKGGDDAAGGPVDEIGDGDERGGDGGDERGGACGRLGETKEDGEGRARPATPSSPGDA